MITIFSAGLLGSLPFLMSTPLGNYKTISGKFTYLGNDDVTVREYDYTYSDAYFNDKANESSYELLKCSMNVALAASRPEYIMELMDKLGFSYSNKIDEEKEGINILAGSPADDSIYYPAQIVNNVDYYNSIAYGIGKKSIGDTTLILVAIRGSDYGIEWGGDFDIGTGENHEGFQIASEQVLEGLKSFIKNEGINGKIKIWTAGYSRGAATANLFAAALDDGAVEGITKDDVYAFCFECPRTTKNEKALTDEYDNIYCVANPDDIVPKVAMGVWGYRRFGRTFHMPAYQSDADYSTALNKKDEAEKEILGEVLKTAQDVSYQLNTFIEDLAIVAQSPEGYVKNYQDSLIRVAMATFGKPNSMPTREDYAVFEHLGRGMALINRENTEEIARLLGSEGSKLRILPGNELLNVHNMENSLAWLDAMADFSDFGENEYVILSLINASGITVKDSEDTNLVSVTDYKVSPIEGGLFTRVRDSGEIIVVFPVDSDYQFSISASGPVSLNCSNFKMALGYPSRMESYDLSGSVDGEIHSGRLRLESGKRAVEPSRVLEGDDIKLVTVTGEPNRPGFVSGGGYFVKGERVLLRAISLDGTSFDGWYQGERRISSENPYSFIAEESQNLRAVFR